MYKNLGRVYHIYEKDGRLYTRGDDYDGPLDTFPVGDQPLRDNRVPTLKSLRHKIYLPKTIGARIYALYNNHCALCGNPAGNRLEIHHRDEDRTNNSDENLILLCCVCHHKHHKRPFTPHP